MERAQIVIVGAGITGLSIAYHLGLQGVRGVVVLEKERIGAGASGVAPGGVRQQWSTPVNCRLSRESFRFYQRVNEILEPDHELVFRECGYLFLAHSPEALEGLRANVAVQRQNGIPSSILDPAEVRDLVPALRTDTVLGASYCPEDGYFDDPFGVVYAFAQAARRLGAHIRYAEVQRLSRNGPTWTLWLKDGSRVEAEHVIVATGYDTPGLLEPLGIDTRIRPEPRYLFFSEHMEERFLDPLVVSPERQFAAKQLGNGQVMASYLAAGRGPSGAMARLDWEMKLAEVAQELLPRLQDVSLSKVVEGFYDSTPDHQPVIGPVEGHPNLWLAVGLSGHGFMMAPAIGRMVAAMLVGGDMGAIADSLQAFSIDRFRAGVTAAESQIV